jgi:hypothetical protein
MRPRWSSDEPIPLRQPQPVGPAVDGKGLPDSGGTLRKPWGTGAAILPGIDYDSDFY